MLTAEQIKSLKKVNISRDAEKTKTRVEKDFKSTTNENKSLIVKLSGLSRNSFYRVFDTGAITPKVALSIGQILNVSPYYYIGAEEEKGTYNDETVLAFLNEFGYKQLASALKGNMKTKRKYTRKPKMTEVSEETVAAADKKEAMETIADLSMADVGTGTVSISLNNSQKMMDAVANLDEESAVLLLKALIKRAEGGGNAEILCGLVKHCLLS